MEAPDLAFAVTRDHIRGYPDSAAATGQADVRRTERLRTERLYGQNGSRGRRTLNDTRKPQGSDQAPIPLALPRPSAPSSSLQNVTVTN